MEPKFVTLPAIKIAGYELKTRNDGENSKAIPAFWEKYLIEGMAKKLHSEEFVKNHSEYGACFGIDPETDESTYVIGVEIKENAKIGSEYYTCKIPPATYAVFRTPPAKGNEFSISIQSTWQFIWNEWFQKSGYEYAKDGVEFELYNDDDMQEDNMICEIHIPIVKK